MKPYAAVSPQRVAGRQIEMQVGWIVDRLHVGQSNIAVVRALRAKLTGTAWSNKASRKRVYRLGLKRHAANRKLYNAVNRGDFR